MNIVCKKWLPFHVAVLTLVISSHAVETSPGIAGGRHWIDPDTGHRIARLSQAPGENQSLYFHQNQFTASGDKLVFENGGSDKSRTSRGFWTNRIYVYDFPTKKSELLTDDGGKVILVAAHSRQVYHQRSNTLFATQLDTRERKTLAQLPPRWRVSAVNADETFAAGTFVEGGPPLDTSGPKSSWFDKVFEAGRPGGIFLVNLKSGDTKVIRRGTNWFNHLQFSPTDPTLLQFCHEGPWHKLDRIWQIRVDGAGLRLVHARTMPMEIAGHEFWSRDGQTVWFDLQMPRGEKFYLAGVKVSGEPAKEIRYAIARDQWSVHYNVSWDGKLFAGDGGDSRMVAHAENGKWIYLFTPQSDGTLKAEKLVNMAKHDYDLEPNVQFTPDGKWIVFRANFEGRTQVYAVEVAKPRDQVDLEKKRFVVTDHGAVGDGRTLNTKAIQEAIDRCAAEGGGRVVIPKGTFISGSIFLKQGVNLTIEKEGILKGSENTNDYPWIDTRIAGLEMKWPAGLVNADGLTNVLLCGEGTVDGSGDPWWRRYWQMRREEKDDIDPHFKVPRPRLVHFIRCQNVLVRDLLLQNSAFWNLQLTYCDGVEVHNLKIRAPHVPVKAASSDGIDLDSTRNVLVEGCDIECDDDAICLKSGRDADGLRVNRPTENVVIRNCRVGHAAGLVVFGSETSGGIRNVRIYDCRADNGCSEVVRFKTRMGRGGVVEDVLYENIEADGVRQVISFNMDAYGTTWLPEQFRAPVPAAQGTPAFRNITVRNLTAKNCTAAGHLVGLPESPLRNITLENVDVQAGKAFTIRNARGINFKNVKVNGKTVEPPQEAMAGLVKEKVVPGGTGAN